MATDVSVSADSHVALMAMAWDLVERVSLADRPEEKRLSIRVNLFNKIYSALRKSDDLTPEEVKRILECKSE
jgi:hypothetical protein